ncbi:hypothetical protein GGR57DRAFT_498672 [Xylariaceae sp. FL1272]|nr:hypothetical protein GGR57DRAFT_498672 [Xylariaceae sp. FL1272]
MSPLSVLAAGNTTAERSMFFTVAGDLLPAALYKSIRHQYFGVALSLLASAFGSLLTIAAPGLWNDVTDKISWAVTTDVRTKWDVDFSADNSPSQDSVDFFGWLEHGGQDDESLIWDNVVLPSLRSPLSPMSAQFKVSAGEDTSEYSLVVPSI